MGWTKTLYPPTFLINEYQRVSNVDRVFEVRDQFSGLIGGIAVT